MDVPRALGVQRRVGHPLGDIRPVPPRHQAVALEHSTDGPHTRRRHSELVQFPRDRLRAGKQLPPHQTASGADDRRLADLVDLLRRAEGAARTLVRPAGGALALTFHPFVQPLPRAAQRLTDRRGTFTFPVPFDGARSLQDGLPHAALRQQSVSDVLALSPVNVVLARIT